MNDTARAPTRVYWDPIYLEHDPGPGHPETARRLAAAHESLVAAPIPGTEIVAPRLASRDEILRIHAPEHYERVAHTADVERTRLDMDTSTSPQSYEAALKAAGGTIQAVEDVVSGAADGAFALVRPPGHHAEGLYAKGFCLFNNIAVAAAHAVDAGGLERVLVVDPDVHHGNGTQHSFWRRPEVLYVSSHRYPFFPGTGVPDEIGEGPGRGYTVNLPHSIGATDADLLYFYEVIVDGIVRAYEPQLILVSAGFDTWKDDPLGGCRMTEDGYEALYAIFRGWADRFCPGRMVCTLEGGYDPEGVVVGVRAALGVMAAERAPELSVHGRVSETVRQVAHGVQRELAPIWKDLGRVRI